jgi:hypothetical protein
MAKKQAAKKPTTKSNDISPVVAAELAGVIYRAKLENRAAKLNISEDEVVAEVIRLFKVVHEKLSRG